MSLPSPEVGFLQREFESEGDLHRYVVWVPPDYNSQRSWPVILFLHGAGERGNDGWRQTQVGVGEAIRWNPDRFSNVIVVFPQAPADSRWLDAPARAAMKALDRTISEFRGDWSRIYLTGMSMGGYGTWHLAIENPGRFAAIAPVCGGIVPPPDRTTSVRQLPVTIGSSNPYRAAAAAMPRLPVWILHGADDPIIPVSESRRMFEELKAAGFDVRYTEFPGVGHSAWEPAYGEQGLWDWMLAQKK